MINFLCLICLGFLTGGVDDDEQEGFIQELPLGETAEVQEKGEIQMTLAPSFSEGGERDWPLVLEYGLDGRWELAFSVPYEERDEGSGWGSGEIELGYAIDLNSPWLLKAQLGAGHPLDRGFDDGSWVWEAGISLSRSFGVASFHGGLNLEEELEENEREVSVNAAVVFFTGTWRGLIDSQYSWEDDEDPAWLAPGLVYSFGEFELVLSAVLGMNDAAEDHAWQAAITFEWD